MVSKVQNGSIKAIANGRMAKDELISVVLSMIKGINLWYQKIIFSLNCKVRNLYEKNSSVVWHYNVICNKHFQKSSTVKVLIVWDLDFFFSESKWYTQAFFSIWSMFCFVFWWKFTSFKPNVLKRPSLWLCAHLCCCGLGLVWLLVWSTHWGGTLRAKKWKKGIIYLFNVHHV